MKTIVTSGKRKSAIARATIKRGKGRIRINKENLEFYTPAIYKMKIKEALMLAGEYANKVDIDVRVKGGGINSQAEAARLAIAKSLVAFTKSKKLEKQFLDYDRHLLVADVRRKEVKKPNTHGSARSKVQKSYR